MTLTEAVFLVLALLLAAFCAMAAYMSKRYPNEKFLPWFISAIGTMTASLLFAAMGFNTPGGVILSFIMFAISAGILTQTFNVLGGSPRKWPKSSALSILLTTLSCGMIALDVPFVYANIPFNMALTLLFAESAWCANTGNSHDNISKIITLCLAAMATLFLIRGMGYMLFFNSNASFLEIVDSKYEFATMLSVAIPGMIMTMLLFYRTLEQTALHFQNISRIDPLTGLLNRSAFTTEIASAKAGSWLILCDIDHFKRVNDTWGHAAGDVSLKCLSTLLQNLNMSAARIGGEEFAVYLPLATPSQARLVAEGLRTAFSLQQIDGLPDDTRLTASFGVAPWAQGDSFESVFKRADTALYRAKNEGRDRVVVATTFTSSFTEGAATNAA